MTKIDFAAFKEGLPSQNSCQLLKFLGRIYQIGQRLPMVLGDPAHLVFYGPAFQIDGLLEPPKRAVLDPASTSVSALTWSLTCRSCRSWITR